MEADSLEEAIEKAESGDTVGETAGSLQSIEERSVFLVDRESGPQLPRLVVFGTMLALPGQELLVHTYPSGDVDTVNWPDFRPAILRGALYDARETNEIPDVPAVLLPDGRRFAIDGPYWRVGYHVTWQDPDDDVCSRTGYLTRVTWMGDDRYLIQMDGEWEAEVHEDELTHVKETN